MAFQTPVKSLNRVDIALPEHVVKGAVVVGKHLKEWIQEPLPPSAPTSTFVVINKEEEDVADLCRRVGQELNLPSTQTYSLLFDNPPQFLTSKNLDRLSNGFMLFISASMNDYLEKAGGALKTMTDVTLMEWASAKVEQFSSDKEFMNRLLYSVDFTVFFVLVADERVTTSSQFLNSCLNNITNIMDLGIDGVDWSTVPYETIVAIASQVTGRAKREEETTLLIAFQILEQLVNSPSDRTKDWVLEEVAIETLIRHLDRSKEQIVMAALSLMNALLRNASTSKRLSMFETCRHVPFRTTINGQLKTGRFPDRSLLVALQKNLISTFDTSEVTEADLQKVLDILLVNEIHGCENAIDLLKTAKCGKFDVNTVGKFVQECPQDVRMILSENSMRTEGGKWELIPMLLSSLTIVEELFGIIPGEERLESLISLIFSLESPLDAIFGVVVHLFHRTWREMLATDSEIEKVSHVVREQVYLVVKRRPATIDQLTAELETVPFWKMQETWQAEQTDKEKDVLNSANIRDLRDSLRPGIEELVRQNGRNHMKEGFTFRRNAKGKNKASYWFWKLDTSEKMLTIMICDTENPNDSTLSGDNIRQVWIKDIAEVNRTDEVDRSSKSGGGGGGGTPRSTQTLVSGIRLQLTDGEVLVANTPNEKIASKWVDGLSCLIGKKSTSGEMNKMVDRLLKMELRIRLLEVCVDADTPPIPPFPAAFAERIST